jgi:hypothetical protein
MTWIKKWNVEGSTAERREVIEDVVFRDPEKVSVLIIQPII